jgi:hypothetical protein
VYFFFLQTFAIGSGAQYVLSKGTLGNLNVHAGFVDDTTVHYL